LKKVPVKIEFSVKKKEELKDLTYEELLKYIEDLTDHLVTEKPKKNSDNSSIAPSSDIGKKKKNQSLRPRSNKKPGGQAGRKGTTLEQFDIPDKTIDIDYTIKHCKKCGASLEQEIISLKEKRQILDINLQDITVKIIQYQSFSKVCPSCGCENHDNAFPSNVAPHISYGSSLQSLVAYLSVSHYLSYGRIRQLLLAIFDIKLSEGTIDSMIKKASGISQPIVDDIAKRLALSTLVGIDETGCRVDGKRHWHWTFQNDKDTLIVADSSRGTKVIDKHFMDGFKNACVLHDNFSSYNKLIAKEEQLCLAHKLRDINYAIECDNTLLMRDMKALLKEAMHDHKNIMTTEQRVLLKREYEATFDYLLRRPVIQKSETARQINSLTKAREKIFTFLEHPDIPPDNNGSERAIRNIKVKLKVSGQFKTLRGAQDYANLRSIVDTSRKRGLNEFESLVKIVKGEFVF